MRSTAFSPCVSIDIQSRDCHQNVSNSIYDGDVQNSPFDYYYYYYFIYFLIYCYCYLLLNFFITIDTTIKILCLLLNIIHYYQCFQLLLIIINTRKQTITDPFRKSSTHLITNLDNLKSLKDPKTIVIIIPDKSLNHQITLFNLLIFPKPAIGDHSSKQG